MRNSGTLIRVSSSESSGGMEEVAANLNFSITRGESFEFGGVARYRRALWRGVAADVRLSSHIYGPLLFVLGFGQMGMAGELSNSSSNLM